MRTVRFVDEKIRELSVSALVLAEKAFLLAHGWTQGPKGWSPPVDWESEVKTPHELGHAVNSVKAWAYRRMGRGPWGDGRTTQHYADRRRRTWREK